MLNVRARFEFIKELIGNMKIKFQLTDPEYIVSRRKSNLLGNMGWRNQCVELLCLLPSCVLVLLSGIWIALVSYLIILAVVLAITFKRMLAKTAVGNIHEFTLTVDDFSLLSEFSHSKFEVKLSQYDDLEENDEAFFLWRLGRCTLIPKRVLASEEVEELRRLIINSQSETVDDATNEKDVALFVDLFKRQPLLANFESEIHRFCFIAEDVYSAGAEPLQIYDPEVPSVASKFDANKMAKSRFWNRVVMVGLFFLAIPFALSQVSGLGEVPAILLVVAIALPFFLILFAGRSLRKMFEKSNPVIPPNEFQLRLLPSGWAMGTPDYAFHYDWRDVECIYENSFCVGFKTNNDLIQVIPKRIFSEGAAQKFMRTATALKLEYLKKIERESPEAQSAAILGAETGNPFQPPMS